MHHLFSELLGSISLPVVNLKLSLLGSWFEIPGVLLYGRSWHPYWKRIRALRSYSSTV